MPADADPTTGIASSGDPVDLRMIAHDLWPRRLIERREGLPVTTPARVFWPTSDAEVQAIVRAAIAERRPVVPFGAGSGVCGGISPTSTSWMIDLKRMDRLLAIDEARGTCTVEAGMIGDRLERALNARGFTLGHFPSSIYISTVGGWVATRSAGQLSSRYGKIEDMVVAVEGVDGTGAPIAARVDDPATGPGLVRLLVGSEGALCVITRATLRVHRAPSHRWLRAFTFEDLGTALHAMRMLLASGEAPSVLRLYDPLDTALAGAAPPDAHEEPDRIVAGGIARAGLEDSGPHDDADEEPGLFSVLSEKVDEWAVFARPGPARRVVGEILARPSLANSLVDRWLSSKGGGASRLILGIEGDADDVGARAPALKRRLAAVSAKDIGGAPGRRWLEHRHRVSYKMSRAFAVGAWVDTMEVATTWEKVRPLYDDVRAALVDVAVVMCHFSHAYKDGCSLYFTFAGGGTTGTGPRSALGRYDLAWDRALTTVRRHGAAISHHHGVGRSKAKVMPHDGGHAAILARLKATFDPHGVLNPGVLGLGGPP